jgi:hypothetical protein
MKMRVSMVADLTLIPSIVTGVALGKIDADSLQIEPVLNGEDRREAIKKALPTKAKRKVGRPKGTVPDRVIAAVRQLQNSTEGATLSNIRRKVKSTSVPPAITDLIKSKKLIRTKPGHYKVA